MKVLLKMMVDDARYAPLDRPAAIEGMVADKEDFFLDGPVTGRVAVLDFNAETGALEPGARFVPPAPGRVRGKYDLPDPPDITSRVFNQVSVFATVLNTIYLYEKEDTLGRRVRWAFDAPQLLVVPRAGRWENAFYERDSHSLQFFYFPNHMNPAEMIYTSLARDIVAHETGHAILDGIAPHLWNAITPQSLALHEAVGDLSALVVSMDSDKLRASVLEATRDQGGSIKNATHFSAIAEEFGLARGTGALRDLWNELTLNQVDASEPHDLCQVLTGALYKVLVDMHDDYKQWEMARRGRSEFSVSGKALALAANHFRRMTLRALDYLPPGEISFADYGRAIIAADQAAHPNQPEERQRMVEEFVKRGLARSAAALQVEPPDGDLSGIDLDDLVASDWAAYNFANSPRGRKLLGIPAKLPFHVEPRLEVQKLYYHHADDPNARKQKIREVLFKVWWYQEEENRLTSRFPSKRRITVGSTLSWDMDTSKIRVLLTSDHRSRPEEQQEQQASRDLFLGRLADKGVLRVGRQALWPDGTPQRNVVSAATRDGVLRVAGAARTLHIVGEA